MKLWHCLGSRSFRVLWALEEMELEYEIEVVRFPPRIFQKQYLKINPLGTVPYFVDGETQMTESVAICQYLVEKYNKNEFGVHCQEPEYGEFLNWLYHSEATLTFPQTVAMRYRILEPGKFPEVGDSYIEWYFARLRLLEEKIKGREFLCAGKFTIADIAIIYALYLGGVLGVTDRYSPELQDYLSRMKERPAFQKAEQTVGP
ncbi:MAG: glutathione S-transferase family protein [Pseudomonadales bacterium]|nr:glutathione S-transferase family protein [Pseudomonadales bacterium]